MGTMAPFAKLYITSSRASSRLGLLTEPPPPLSPLESRLRGVVSGMIHKGDVLGIQVVVVQNGKAIVDLVGGCMGEYDPRPVQHDSLFPVFSCTKAITAAAAYMYIQDGKLQLSDNVTKHWPSFASSIEEPMVRYAKEGITVRDFLTHKSGMADAGMEALSEDAFAVTDFNKMVAAMETAVPTDAPGESTQYHFLSFGWLVGGLVQKVSGRPFGDTIAEMLRRMGVGVYGHVGIPRGVEKRLTSLHWDSSEVRGILAKQLGLASVGDLEIADLVGESESAVEALPAIPAVTARIDDGDAIAEVSQAAPPVESAADRERFDQARRRLAGLRMNPMLMNPTFFNHLRVRQSVIPAASGNFSARGLATFYSNLLSSEPGAPEPMHFEPPKGLSYIEERHLVRGNHGGKPERVFSSETVRSMREQTAGPSDSIIGSSFGNGFHLYRFRGSDGSINEGYGHSGMGGSFAFAHPSTGVCVAFVINKISLLGGTNAPGHEILSIIAEACGLGVPVTEGERDVTMNPLELD